MIAFKAGTQPGGYEFHSLELKEEDELLLIFEMREALRTEENRERWYLAMVSDLSKATQESFDAELKDMCEEYGT